MPNLFPIFEMPELVEQQQTQPEPEYPESYFFDFEKGDFARDGAGRIAIADGHTAWAQWCIKTVLTERFAYLAYSHNYGTEMESALKQPSRKAVEAELERVITEALLADSRTEMVRDFIFVWVDSQLRVNFIVVPTVGDPERLEVIYNAG
jgi:hypothetical protein